MTEPKIVLLIFVSGKLVLTGAKVKIFNLFFIINEFIKDIRWY